MIDFGDSMFAGTVLVRSAMQSPNYVAGVSGWSINQDGSAEFNNVTSRGEVVVTGTDNTSIRINSTTFGDPRVLFRPPDTPAGTPYAQSGWLRGDYANTATPFVYSALLELESPSFSPQSEAAAIRLFSETSDGVTAPSIDMFGTGGNLTVTMEGSAAVRDTLTVFGNDIGRGLVATGGITSNFAVGTSVAESSVVAAALPDASGPATFKAGRLYRVHVQGSAFTTATTTQPLLRIRKGLFSGQQLDVWRATPTAAGSGGAAPITFTSYFKVLGSDVTSNIVLTLANVTAGQTVTVSASATGPCSINIYDEGPANNTDRSWVPILV